MAVARGRGGAFPECPGCRRADRWQRVAGLDRGSVFACGCGGGVAQSRVERGAVRWAVERVRGRALLEEGAARG